MNNTRNSANTASTTTGGSDELSATVTADMTKKLAIAAHQAVDKAAEKAAEAERTLRDKTATNEEALREVADKTSLKAKQLKSDAQRYVDNNPLAAAGIAFVAGILVSAWMRR